MKHCIFKSTIIRESVIEVLGCFCDECLTLCTNGHVSAIRADVTTTSLNGCPIQRQRLCTSLSCMHWIRHLPSDGPICTVRYVLRIITGHEPNPSFQVKFCG